MAADLIREELKKSSVKTIIQGNTYVTGDLVPFHKSNGKTMTNDAASVPQNENEITPESEEMMALKKPKTNVLNLRGKNLFITDSATSDHRIFWMLGSAGTLIGVGAIIIFIVVRSHSKQEITQESSATDENLGENDETVQSLEDEDLSKPADTTDENAELEIEGYKLGEENFTDSESYVFEEEEM